MALLAAETATDPKSSPRIAIHRDNALISLAEVLKAAYPVVCRVAGEGFFRHAARDYVRAHPPRGPQLWAYGGKFEKFLERYEPAQPLRFLPDLARLEWAWNESYFAAAAGLRGRRRSAGYRGVGGPPAGADSRTALRRASVGAQGHRFAAMDEVPVLELDQEDYLARVNCEYPDHFDALGVPERCEVNIRYRSEREDWIQAMILAGLGCTVMAESMPMLPGVQTRRVCDPDVSRTTSLVTVSGRRYTPTVKSLIELAERHDWTAAGSASP